MVQAYLYCPTRVYIMTEHKEHQQQETREGKWKFIPSRNMEERKCVNVQMP